MSLLHGMFDDMPLCLISNRDEFYHRPSAPLHQWENCPIVAGQDLQSGGTWMGVTAGRWAIVTNFRNVGQEPVQHFTRTPDSDFLESDLAPSALRKCWNRISRTMRFNLFLGDREQAVAINRGEAPQVLTNGVYVVSNGLMSEDWHKTRHLRKRFTQEFLPMLQQSTMTESDLQYSVWDILEDERKIIPNLLPDTGDYGNGSIAVLDFYPKPNLWHTLFKFFKAYI
ncbi:MAG: NRDE family protein [Acinetobacter parvus]